MHGNKNKQPNPRVQLLLGYFVGMMRFLIRSLLRNTTSCVTRLTCFGQEKSAFHFSLETARLSGERDVTCLDNKVARCNSLFFCAKLVFFADLVGCLGVGFFIWMIRVQSVILLFNGVHCRF